MKARRCSRQASGFLASLLIVAALSCVANAQDKASPRSPEQCYLFGMAFSEGAVARGGTGTVVCRSDSTWGESMSQAAGCIYESKVYSTGALKAVGDVQNTELECLSDGTWSPLPTVKKQ